MGGGPARNAIVFAGLAIPRLRATASCTMPLLEAHGQGQRARSAARGAPSDSATVTSKSAPKRSRHRP